jgi:hypothetical protein
VTNVKLKILVDEASRADIPRIEAALKEKGLEIRASIPEFRTILGTGDSALVQQFRSVQGVEGVRPEGGFQLPPMDEKVPQ